jgi:protein required for attachment to host cells
MEDVRWIVVADANRARIFSAPTSSLIRNEHCEHNLNLVQELGHHDSHKKMHDVISDKAGSNNYGTFVGSSDPKEADAANFAQNIAEYLEKNRNQHKYAEIVIVSPPHFMGLLKKHFSNAVEKLVTTYIDKDYTAENEKFLIEHLKSYT